MTHRARTPEQENFLRNVERAQAADITTKTSQSVQTAILAGLSYCQFSDGQIGDTQSNDYLIFLQDMLADEAIEQAKFDDIKWVGFES